jgi:Prephenate dehydratase
MPVQHDHTQKSLVAYAGGAAAHSAAAAERLFPANGDLVSLATFEDVVGAAVSGRTAYGVLPIENSLIGRSRRRTTCCTSRRRRSSPRRRSGSVTTSSPGSRSRTGRSVSCARIPPRSSSAAACCAG